MVFDLGLLSLDIGFFSIAPGSPVSRLSELRFQNDTNLRFCFFCFRDFGISFYWQKDCFRFFEKQRKTSAMFLRFLKKKGFFFQDATGKPSFFGFVLSLFLLKMKFLYFWRWRTEKFFVLLSLFFFFLFVLKPLRSYSFGRNFVLF